MQLSEWDRSLVDAVAAYKRRHGHDPTGKQLHAFMSTSDSVRTIQVNLSRLAAKGHLTRHENRNVRGFILAHTYEPK